MQCHSTAAGRSLGLETAQQNGPFLYPSGTTSNQLETLEGIGMFANSLGGTPETLPALAAIDDLGQGLGERARSYLHANCSICHRPDGPGQGPMDFRFQKPLEEAGICGAASEISDLGVAGARIVFPGDAARSLVSLRMHTLGSDRMPPLGSQVVDAAGTALIDEWINDLSSCMPDTAPPTVPANVRAEAQSDTEIELSWNASADDGGGVVEYQVTRNGDAVALVAGTVFTDAGLTPGTTYHYGVAARDAAGNVSSQGTVEVATFAADEADPSEPPPSPVRRSSNTGGGGAMGGLWLCLLAVLVFARREPIVAARTTP